MIRIIIFLIGFGLSVIGFTYIILYLNLLTVGYSYKEYFLFILKRRECLYALVGFLIVTIVIFTKKGEINGLHI